MISEALLAAAAVTAKSPQEGLQTAVKACESWILDPATWADQISEFPKQAGLSGQLQAQDSVPDVALPPPELRNALHFWHVPVGQGGYFVTVSDVKPFCHIAGGGPDDFEPGAEAALTALISKGSWRKVADKTNGGLRSSELVSGQSDQLTMTLTRAATAGQPTDRVQVLATAVYEIKR
jgi:hypothetical protein